MFNSSKISPFVKLDPFRNNSNFIEKEFLKLIKNKDKKYLNYIQILLTKRLNELNNNNNNNK